MKRTTDTLSRTYHFPHAILNVFRTRHVCLALKTSEDMFSSAAIHVERNEAAKLLRKARELARENA